MVPEGDVLASEVLSAWGHHHHDVLQDDCDGLEEIAAADAKRYFNITADLGGSCSFIANTKQLNLNSKINISQIIRGAKVNNVTICILKNDSGLRINIGGQHCRVFVGRVGYAFNADINIWNNSTIIISDHSTCNQARIVLDNSKVFVGYDAMLSDEVLIQSSDQHGIVDLDSMTIINNKPRSVHIGRHVWIGRKSIVMPDCRIGDGTIIGTGSVVTSDIEGCAIAVGVPAKVVRRNRSWSRRQNVISAEEQSMLSDLLAKQG